MKYHEGHRPWLPIALPYNPVPVAIKRYETLYAGHGPMTIRESFKWHFQHFWGCDDAQADMGEYWADELIAGGMDPLAAWEKVYDRAGKRAAFIESRERVETETKQMIEDALGYKISEEGAP